MMNKSNTLKEFMISQKITTKSELADRIGISSNQLSQFLRTENSSTFLFKLTTKFREFNFFYDEASKQYLFEHADSSDLAYQGMTVHIKSKQGLQEGFVYEPALYSFISLLECEEFGVYYEDPSEKVIVISELRTSRVFGRFSVSEFPNALEEWLQEE